MKQYDDDQLTAINAQKGYYLVLAPPGCGKTDILAERVVRARESGVTFDDMLCLTFTNRASRGMRSRIMEAVGEDARDIFVGNIHRFCSKYIFNNNVVPENTSILDDDDQTDLFLSYEEKHFKNGAGTVDKNAVQFVVHLATYITQSLLGHHEGIKPADERYPSLYRVAQEAEFDPRLGPTEHKSVIFALQYINYKKSRGIIDFEDILVIAYDHLLHHEHKIYPWIQVDEVQDLNPLQLAIVDQLTAQDPTVMYLGDEQQAIFSFMGAKLSLLNVLKERCKGHLLTLGNNYRAPAYMLDVCNEYAAKVLNVDPELLPRPINDTPKQKFDLILTESETIRDERNRILKMVQHYLKLDDSGRLAILVTRNREADDISDTLTKAGIRNFKISGTDMFRTPSFKTLSSLYCVIANDFNFIAWSRLLHGIGAIRTLVLARSFMTGLKHLMMTPSDLMSDETYLQRFIRYYDTREFVFFDTETTGLNVLEDDIVQIAAFKVRGGKKVPGSDFNILLETNRPIPPMLGYIVNPLIEEYADNPHLSREAGLRKFIEYIGDRPLLGHNVTYDYQILKNNVERTLNLDIDYDIFDSLHIIKCVEPRLRMYKLAFLLSELNLVGENSHLANEDIEATKSLVDYCVDKIRPTLKHQSIFLDRADVKYIMSRMRVLTPLFDNIKTYLYKPISITRHTIADELSQMYQKMLDKEIIHDIGPKFDIFIKYIQSEWTDCEKSESLYDQIYNHVYDITASINEGDLVNSEDLLKDRVFIMTVYKGKGLEFDNVVVLSASQGTYPYYMTDKILSSPKATTKQRAKAALERMEDARKLYVAISRAKKRLCISYTRRGAWDHPAGISPFLVPIWQNFYFFRDVK